MRTDDHIENAEEPLDVTLPLDQVAEMQEFFGIFVPEAK